MGSELAWIELAAILDETDIIITERELRAQKGADKARISDAMSRNITKLLEISCLSLYVFP